MPSATNARYVVIAFAVALAVITYVDRVAISVSVPFIRKDLGLSPAHMGWALAAFGWAYAIFEIPGGWLGDRIGPRRVLMRIVIWWSLFTAATGWAWNGASLVAIRALFGAGEAGAFPNLTRVLTTWLPVKERERAQATLWLATRVSGAFTPLLVATLIGAIGWRRTFEIFGLLGVVWAVFFYRWFRDAPSEHPAVNAAELAMLPPQRETAVAHGGVPWRTIFSTPAVWLLSVQYMCLAYGWWFYINWLPTYLRDARGATLRMGALLAGLPLLLGGLGCFVSAGVDTGARAANRQRGVGPPDCCGDGFHRRFDLRLRLHDDRRSRPRHVRARPGRVLQRLRDAGRLGRDDGRGRTVCRNGFRSDEHAGESRRCIVGPGRRLSPDVDRQLDADVLYFSHDLSHRRRLLVVPGFAYAHRAARGRCESSVGVTARGQILFLARLSSF